MERGRLWKKNDRRARRGPAHGAARARLLAEDGHPVRTWGLAAFGMEDTARWKRRKPTASCCRCLSRAREKSQLHLCGAAAVRIVRAAASERASTPGGVRPPTAKAAAEFGLTLTDYLSREARRCRKQRADGGGAIEGDGRDGRRSAARRVWSSASGASASCSPTVCWRALGAEGHGPRGWTISRMSAFSYSTRTVSPDGSGSSHRLQHPYRTSRAHRGAAVAQCVLSLQRELSASFDTVRQRARRGLKHRCWDSRQGCRRPARHQSALEKIWGMRTERIGFALCGSFCNHPKIFDSPLRKWREL